MFTLFARPTQKENQSQVFIKEHQSSVGVLAKRAAELCGRRGEPALSLHSSLNFTQMVSSIKAIKQHQARSSEGRLLKTRCVKVLKRRDQALTLLNKLFALRLQFEETRKRNVPVTIQIHHPEIVKGYRVCCFTNVEYNTKPRLKAGTHMTAPCPTRESADCWPSYGERIVQRSIQPASSDMSAPTPDRRGRTVPAPSPICGV
ncbi:hypothetical protein J6590_076303 [Homalodisca vitripennis]|nr:hypothetical protein J6590_076303 [Homalodisca vitripennis]